MQPSTKYARGAEGHVAYQVLGEGPRDIVFVPEHPNNIEIMWEEPTLARFLERLATMGRVICFDKRGTGISDPVPLGAIPTIERWMDDITTVIDAVGCQRVVVFGHGDGGPIAMLFAATYPERTEALVLGDTFARMRHAGDYLDGLSEAEADSKAARLSDFWGRDDSRTRPRVGYYSNPSFSAWRARFERLSLSPGAIALMYPVCDLDVDVRSVLASIRTPTLVFHRRDNQWIPAAFGRYLADHIAEAKFVEIDGAEHFYYTGDVDRILSAVNELVTGKHEMLEDDRVLATVLFTDIVGSTEKASTLGDRAWRDLLARHHAAIRREIAHFRGREIATAGDGFLVLFDGPARGVRCGLAVRDAVRPLGLDVRVGLHTGECERMGENVGGIAVHIGARIAAAADPGEVLVSSTVKDLVVGSGLTFEDRGNRALKGVDGEWRLFAAT
jgi:class 3 adenylate cyclase/predicted alpha/beta hydrolase